MPFCHVDAVRIHLSLCLFDLFFRGHRLDYCQTLENRVIYLLSDIILAIRCSFWYLIKKTSILSLSDFIILISFFSLLEEDMNHSLLQYLEFTALDIETSGLDPNENEVLEIAAIRFDRDKILNTYNFLVKPNKPLQLNAQNVNGITLKMLENAKSLDEVLPEFFRFIEGSALVIQNSEFDLSFLLPEAKKRQLSIPTLPVFCTLNMTRKFFPELKKHSLVALRDYFKIEKMNTTSSRHSFHEALDDSFAAMKVFIHCIDKINGWELDMQKTNYHAKGYRMTIDYIRQDWLF